MKLRRSCPLPAARRPAVHRRVYTAAHARVGRYLSRQAARPHGAFGRLLARIWVNETAAVNDTAIELLAPAPGERIGEIGFGPGRTLAKLAAAGAEVVGVELSAVMVATATRRNTTSIATGQMRLHQGDGTTLPVADNSLDAVIGVHTIYFWVDPMATLADVARALRPGGRVVLAFRSGEHPLPARFDPATYHVPTTIGATEWLESTAFTEIRAERRAHIDPTIVWLTATATPLPG